MRPGTESCSREMSSRDQVSPRSVVYFGNCFFVLWWRAKNFIINVVKNNKNIGVKIFSIVNFYLFKF